MVWMMGNVLKKTAALIGIMALITFSATPLFAADSSTGPANGDTVAKLIQNHLAKEAYYEKKAKEEAELIATHMKEKKEFYHKYYINEKMTPKFRLRPMIGHCDIIIHEAQKMRKQFLMFANWHKMRAEELQKK